MSVVSSELSAVGVADVIVVLEPIAKSAGAASKDAMRTLRPYFTGSELSQQSAIIEDGFLNAASDARAPHAPVPAAALHRRRPKGTSAPVRYFPHLGIAYGVVDREGLAALERDPKVRSVTGAPQFRLIRPTKKVSAKLSRKVTWGIKALDISKLWDRGLEGKGVLVAHLDTGIDGRHPALRSALAAFVEFDRLGMAVNTTTTAYDTDDHGTHTAGTIAGRPQSRTGRSIGVAPKAELASAIVIEGGQVVARVLAGLDWAIGQNVRVLSMSLGLPGYFDDFLPVIRILRDNGVLPVIAVGNEGPGTSRSPGNYPESLSVGWANEDDTVDPESSSQEFRREVQPKVPDLVGPGGDIISAAPGGGYQMMSGTSMATPHIAGLAALLVEAEPDATVDAIESAIVESCEQFDGLPATRQGRGMPNAVRALELLT